MASTDAAPLRIARVVVFGAVLVLASWAFWAWRAPEPPPELLLGELLVAHAPPADGGDTLIINGVRVSTAVALFERDLDEVLPRLRAACDESEPAAALHAAARERIAAADDSATVTRGADRAMVSCEPESGRVLHLYAEEVEDGVAVRALSSEGRLPVIGGADGGDAPGRDLADVPRPMGSRRVLSVFTADSGYGMVQLVLPNEALEEQRDAYRDALEEAGFSVSVPPGDGADTRTLIAERGVRRVIAVLDQGAGPDKMVTLLDQGG